MSLLERPQLGLVEAVIDDVIVWFEAKGDRGQSSDHDEAKFDVHGDDFEVV